MALSPALSFGVTVGVTVWGGTHNARYPTYSSTGLHTVKLLGCYRGGSGLCVLLPWLASGCKELRGSGGDDSEVSVAGCSATGQMINHLFPVCKTEKQSIKRVLRGPSMSRPGDTTTVPDPIRSSRKHIPPGVFSGRSRQGI